MGEQDAVVDWGRGAEWFLCWNQHNDKSRIRNPLFVGCMHGASVLGRSWGQAPAERVGERSEAMGVGVSNFLGGGKLATWTLLFVFTC